MTSNYFLLHLDTDESSIIAAKLMNLTQKMVNEANDVFSLAEFYGRGRAIHR